MVHIEEIDDIGSWEFYNDLTIYDIQGNYIQGNDVVIPRKFLKNNIDLEWTHDDVDHEGEHVQMSGKHDFETYMSEYLTYTEVLELFKKYRHESTKL
jgi:hypothetical protein